MDLPSFAQVRNFGSDIYSVSSQPHLNPPCEAQVREIGSSLIKDTDYRDVSSFQPQLDPLLSRGAVNPHPNKSDVQSGQSEEELTVADVVAAIPVFEKFKKEVESLKFMQRQVQEQIGIAKDEGDKILSGVEEWLNKVGDDLSKAEVLLEQEATAKKRCFEEFDHYGKMATKMTPSLLEHQLHGKDFVTSVSDDTPAPESLNIYLNKELDDIVIQNSALNNIIESLEDESKQIIGIYGLGGVGKTTLAMKAVARVKHPFVHVAFSIVSQTVNVKMIQKDLEKATKRIVKGEKVLIILDDVWEKLDLEKLCIPINNANCKILLTSRSEEVCQKMNAESIIYVDSLPAKEAWILFKHVVGERLETDSNLKLVALKVVKECGGLPLFIQVVGNTLKDESIKSWESALVQLRKAKPSKIDPDIQKAFSCLKLSYEYLKSEEAKACFLLCSLFHEAEDIELEDLVRYVVGLDLFDKVNSIEDARGRVQNAVNILTSSGLLLNVEYDKGCTKMRNVVRDVALLIGYEGKDRYKYLFKAGKDLLECLPRNNNVKVLTDYKQTNFAEFHGSFDSMTRMLDRKAPLRAVSKATNHYHDQNIIKDRGSGKVYKGKFKWNGRLMDVAVWRLDRQYRENYVAFRKELEILSDLNHDNISSIVKYFDQDEDGENIIIYENAFHGNLLGHLRNSDPELTWSRRLQICLGVARALNYIHNQARVHCDINSSKILLDKDWEPKIFGFELCTDYPQSWMHRLHFSSYLGNTSVMTPKYDVYLFGVLLFEVLCGNKPMFGEDGLYRKLDEIIESSLRKHRESRSMKSFIKIAYSCLDKELEERPSMNKIVKVLEEALELQRKEENLERSTNRDEGASRNRFLMKYLEIPLQKINDATDNFKKGRIGRGAFGTVYEAILDVLDIESVSSNEGKSKDELTRKISKTVAIKRLPKNGDEQAETSFLTEIGSLTSCIHPNVVPFLGYCREANEMILVFEYASNGDLGDYLRRERSLTWSQRIQICLDVAHGINCLHTNNIIHRDIKSKNILLDENLNAKVADFGLSTLIPTSVGYEKTILTKKVAGTSVYIDPEYRTTGGYKKESDIYAFGVVLFEVLSGKMAYDSTYLREYDDGLAPIVRRRFEERTLTELIDSKMFEEDDEHTFTLNRGPTQDSFDLFSRVGFECLTKTRAGRPEMEVVIKALQDALKAQGKTMVLSRFRLSSIESATQKFTKTYTGSDTYGKVYKAQLDLFGSNNFLVAKGKNNAEQSINVAIKRISGEEEHREERFFSEIDMHARNKHPNIVPLLGICYERDNMLLVYEDDSDESLDNYLRDTDNMSTKHTWIQRLHQCLGIARGLDHLHTLMDQGKQDMIHIDIRSANIMLGRSGEAKIAYFGYSKLLPTNQEATTDTTNNSVCTKVYCCPEYQKTGELKKESDIYSLGVVLFEIFCGRLAYDPVYTVKNDNGLAPIARRCFSDGTIKEMIDPALMEETLEDILTSKGCLRVANQCLAENQAARPKMQIVIKELEKALYIQENLKNFQISLKDIKLATENFSQKNCSGNGRYWTAYKGKLRPSNANLASARGGGGTSYGGGCGDSTNATASVGPTASDANTNTNFIVAKRWDSKSNQGDHQFRTELSIIIKFKHENIIGLVGYCHEMDERIIVYEQASRGSLDMYLNDATLTWMKRLKMCMDVARALEFLHGGSGMLKVVHRNIRSPAIVLDDGWKAKILNLEMSSLDSPLQDMEHVSNNAYGAFGYLDPEYKQGYLTEKSDMYSFGVVMFEILCGRLAWSEDFEDHSDSLGPLAKKHYEEGKLDEIVFKGIKEQIGPESMAKYADIASQCLHDIREKRPTAANVVSQLKKVLDLQLKYLGTPLSEILSATEAFHLKYMIGRGGFGTVYKARLDVIDIENVSSIEGKSKDELPRKISKTVAIKRHLKRRDSDVLDFFTDIELLTSCKHPNIVSLLGFCIEDDELIFVFEFASKGSLGDYLEYRSRPDSSLTWSQRIQICLDVARGIQYLHTNSIIHGDIKSDNILLDENLNAKVADFGLTKSIPMADGGKSSTIYTQNVAGTNIYMDPEYRITGDVLKKESDIYAFGVVLFEVLSGRLAYDRTYMKENDDGLAHVVRRRFKEGTLMELLDPKMFEEDDEDNITLNRGPTKDSFDLFSEIGYKCLAKTRAKRPKMEVVIKTLEDALEAQSKVDRVVDELTG